MSQNTSGIQPQQETFDVQKILVTIQTVNNVYLYLILGTLGIIANILNMIVFVRIGFKDTININLFARAVSDFGISVASVYHSLTANPLIKDMVQYSFTEWAALGYIMAAPDLAGTRVTVAITAFITLERCLCVTMPLKVKTMVTRTKVKCFVAITYFICIISLIPMYYTYRLTWTYIAETNRTGLGLIFFQDGQTINAVTFLLCTILALVEFWVVVICTAILVRTLKQKALWRQTVTSATTSDDIPNKEKKIAKMVTLIASLFIVCYIPLIAQSLYTVLFPDFLIPGSLEFLITMTLSTISGSFKLVNGVLNIVIYYYNSSAFQLTFRKLFFKKKGS